MTVEEIKNCIKKDGKSVKKTCRPKIWWTIQDSNLLPLVAHTQYIVF